MAWRLRLQLARPRSSERGIIMRTTYEGKLTRPVGVLDDLRQVSGRPPTPYQVNPTVASIAAAFGRMGGPTPELIAQMYAAIRLADPTAVLLTVTGPHADHLVLAVDGVSGARVVVDPWLEAATGLEGMPVPFVAPDVDYLLVLRTAWGVGRLRFESFAPNAA